MSDEARVGLLVLGSGALALLFAWMIGVENPFQKRLSFYVTYEFAGGVEVGSPVRVSGIKVGKVEQIKFLEVEAPPSKKNAASDQSQGKMQSAVELKISVRRDAAKTLRQDSEFYINMAGVIGERYIEATPGTVGSKALGDGDRVAGIDPPRIDQLLSQSFDLAGKVNEIVEKHKKSFVDTIEKLDGLLTNVNRTLIHIDKSKVLKTDLNRLINNLIEISEDMRAVTQKTRTPEGEKTLKLLHELLWRLEPLKPEVIREFLQKEGIKANMF